MRNGRRIVDAHIHSFPYIDGISTRGKTQGTKNGRMLVNGVEVSFIPESVSYTHLTLPTTSIV